MKSAITAAALLIVTSAIPASANPDPSSCPLHEQHMKEAAAKAGKSPKTVVPIGDHKHGAEVDGRHNTLVASHTTTTHSFRLFEDGGAIELRANDPADKAIVDGVREHLHEITAQFVKNDFSTPAFVHGRAPAGVAEMGQLHHDISFRYENVDGGGRIRMKTKNAEALAAIHEFLRFQVVEHRTANSGKVEADK